MSNSTRLAWLVENHLSLLCDCNKCWHHAELDPEPILARLGGQYIPDLKQWARCTRCGSRDVSTRPQFPVYGAGFGPATAYR
jgi:hypothetical protein